jgi:hypothetical protein
MRAAGTAAVRVETHGRVPQGSADLAGLLVLPARGTDAG